MPSVRRKSVGAPKCLSVLLHSVCLVDDLSVRSPGLVGRQGRRKPLEGLG